MLKQDPNFLEDLGRSRLRDGNLIPNFNKPTLILFFKPSCPYCQLLDKDFEVLSIREGLQCVFKFVRIINLDGVNYLDSNPRKDISIDRLYSPKIFPTFLAVGFNYREMSILEGYVSVERFLEWVRNVFKSDYVYSS